MVRWSLPLACGLALPAVLAAQVPAPGAFRADWASLDRRPTPAWFQDAKLGIFIHWGPYSVPAYTKKGGYAEWYYRGWRERKPDGAVWAFHQKTYGKDFPYDGFAPLFKAELWDPQAWAALFRKAGARYVVLTSKHHDGYCLWPSAEAPGWNALEVGPKRDLVGDLSAAVKGAGLRMGLYYSLPEWSNATYSWCFPEGGRDVAGYVDRHMIPQIKDLVDRYRPSLFWADGEWDHPDRVWRAQEIVAWLYNHPGVREDLVVNDRWGSNARFKHGGYWATEYTEGMKDTDKPWEECRGLGRSFGLNRNEALEDYQTAEQLIHMFVRLVSEGGNLLLNIGPAADGTIPVIMQERLLELGQWLSVNGEGIYGSRPWVQRKEGKDVVFTRSGDGRFVHAIATRWPGECLRLPGVKVRPGSQVRLLGVDAPIPATYTVREGTTLHIPCGFRELFKGSTAHAFVFRMEAESNVAGPVVLKVGGAPVEDRALFLAQAEVTAATATPGAQLVYTLDGTEPGPTSPRLAGVLKVTSGAILRVRSLREDLQPGPVAALRLEQAELRPAVSGKGLEAGIRATVATGSWSRIPDLASLPEARRVPVAAPTLDIRPRDEQFALGFEGFLQIPASGVYTFHLASDDGSRLHLDGQVLVDHDGMHNDAETKTAPVALAKGLHPFRLEYVQGGGGFSLEFQVEGPGMVRQPVPASWFRRTK